MTLPFTESLRTALADRRTRRARARAVRIALARFGALHPIWHASLFDASFVHRIGVDAVLAGPAVEVARSWTLQFRYADERARERDVRQLVPVVESFVALLCVALEEAARATPGRFADLAPSRGRAPCAEGGLAAHGCA